MGAVETAYRDAFKTICDLAREISAAHLELDRLGAPREAPTLGRLSLAERIGWVNGYLQAAAPSTYAALRDGVPFSAALEAWAADSYEPEGEARG